MTDFREYVCWRDEAVLATTPRDAASLGDGHFQAIHHPLRLRRRRLDERSDGRWVTELEIVDALQGALRPDGYLFIPIVGYGLLAGLAGHVYSRIALSRIRVLARSGMASQSGRGSDE